MTHYFHQGELIVGSDEKENKEENEKEIIYRWKSFEEWYEAKCFNHHLEVRREAFDAARETKEREGE